MKTLSLVFLAVALSGPHGSVAHAACDLIPQAQQSFRSSLGTANRPFASPGDAVELDVRTTLCDSASGGLLPTAGQHVITVVFRPPNSGPRRAVVLTEQDCASAAMTTKLAACVSSLGSNGEARCVRVNQPGASTTMTLVSRANGNHLSFHFPDTAPLFSVGEALAGPATIVVTGTADSLPCAVATTSCEQMSGLIACIDDLANETYTMSKSARS